MGSDMSQENPVYEIYAVRYAGPFERPLAKVLWNTDWERKIEIHYYLWAVKGEDRAVIVDCGVSPSLAQEMGLEGYINPVDLLGEVGIQASEVREVVITHIHFDHADGTGLFPEATFYVQEKEFNFWMKDPVAKKPPFLMLSAPGRNKGLAKLEGTERLVLLRGDVVLKPGIELLLAPGHTPGLQVVAVNTARGVAIVGSDCAHVFRNYDEEIPSVFITDMIAWMRTYDRLKSKASSPDLLFPGHDLKMATDYPKLTERVTRLV